MIINQPHRFLAIIVLLVLGAGCNNSSGVESSVSQNQQVCKTSPATATATVLLKEGRFDPPTISVKQCTKVVFQNVGNQPHWPASDLHPTHGIYPEFDPQENINPGQSWSFVFDRVGQWKCHDHLNPKVRCEVDVY